MHGHGNKWQKPGTPRCWQEGISGSFPCCCVLVSRSCPCVRQLGACSACVPWCAHAMLELQGLDFCGLNNSLIHPMYRAQSLNHQMLSLNKSLGPAVSVSCRNFIKKLTVFNNKHSSQMCFYCKVHPLCSKLILKKFLSPLGS